MVFLRTCSYIASFILKAPHFAYIIVCVYFPLSTFPPTGQGHHAQNSPKGHETQWTSHPGYPLRSKSEIFQDPRNSLKPAAVKHFDPRITLVGNNVPGI